MRVATLFFVVCVQGGSGTRTWGILFLQSFLQSFLQAVGCVTAPALNPGFLGVHLPVTVMQISAHYFSDPVSHG